LRLGRHYSTFGHPNPTWGIHVPNSAIPNGPLNHVYFCGKVRNLGLEHLNGTQNILAKTLNTFCPLKVAFLNGLYPRVQTYDALNERPQSHLPFPLDE